MKYDVSIDMPEVLDLSVLRGFGLQEGEEELPETTAPPPKGKKTIAVLLKNDKVAILFDFSSFFFPSSLSSLHSLLLEHKIRNMGNIYVLHSLYFWLKYIHFSFSK